MQRVRRSRMSVSDKAAMWERWKRGESLSEIGRALDRTPGAIFHVVRARGGIPPAPRCRSSRALTVSEREEISRALATGVSFRQIGLRLGRRQARAALRAIRLRPARSTAPQVRLRSS